MGRSRCCGGQRPALATARNAGADEFGGIAWLGYRPPMRLLLISTRFPDALRPQFGNFIERQAQALAARPGIEVEVVAPLGVPPFPASYRSPHRALMALPHEERRNGLLVHRPRFRIVGPLPHLRPTALARSLLPLGTAIQARQPIDFIIAEFSWPEGPAAVELGRRLGVPVIIKARGLDFYFRTRRAATRRQLLESGLAADGLLAISREMKTAMVEVGLPGDRIHVHYPGIDRDRFSPRDRASAKARLGISGPLLLTVGNLIPEKRQDLAIEALFHLEDATLIIAGGGPQRERLKRRIGELGLTGRVRMAGSVPHALLPELFSAADVCVHTASVEGFGNVRLESLACGTPLVTTGVGDAACLVDRPEAGRIVEADARAIADAVRELLAAPPAPASVRAATERFSWERNAAELEEHLRGLAGPGPELREASE
jgi:teichuronic acid biosynthesis glycosyltransferase TuaC